MGVNQYVSSLVGVGLCQEPIGPTLSGFYWSKGLHDLDKGVAIWADAR